MRIVPAFSATMNRASTTRTESSKRRRGYRLDSAQQTPGLRPARSRSTGRTGGAFRGHAGETIAFEFRCPAVRGTGHLDRPSRSVHSEELTSPSVASGTSG